MGRHAAPVVKCVQILPGNDETKYGPCISARGSDLRDSLPGEFLCGGSPKGKC